MGVVHFTLIIFPPYFISSYFYDSSFPVLASTIWVACTLGLTIWKARGCVPVFFRLFSVTAYHNPFCLPCYFYIMYYEAGLLHTSPFSKIYKCFASCTFWVCVLPPHFSWEPLWPEVRCLLSFSSPPLVHSSQTQALTRPCCFTTWLSTMFSFCTASCAVHSRSLSFCSMHSVLSFFQWHSEAGEHLELTFGSIYLYSVHSLCYLILTLTVTLL